MSETDKPEIIASPRSEKATFSRAATPRAPTPKVQTPRAPTPKVLTPRADIENNEATVTEVKVGKGFYVSRNIIIGVVAGSLLFILAIGLLSGLVFREIGKCDDSSASNQQQATTTTTTPTPTPTTTPTTTRATTTTTTTITNGITTFSTTSSPSSTFSSSSSTSTTRTSTTTTSTSSPAVTTMTSTASTGGPALYENIRLPDLFQPTNYNLKIRFYFSPFGKNTIDDTSFDGEVDITFNLKAATREILFHHDSNLEVLDPLLITNLDTNEMIQVRDEEHRPVKNDYYYINLSQKVLNAGKYKLSVNFRSLYKSLFENRGVFTIKYLDDLVQHTMLATSFSPSETRKGFPCFDEPQLKATFDITIQHPAGTVAISNAQQMSSTFQNNTFGGASYWTTVFRTTPMISPNSIGWVIVPDSYKYNQAITASGKQVRVYGTQFAQTKGLFTHALDVAKKSIDYFEGTYLSNSDGVLSKIDLIAIPDYPFEALESWGIAMFRESSIFYSSSNDAPLTKQNVALSVAQQIAHLWFGGSVSSNWWDEYWFNKASASFLKYKAVDSIFPDWDVINQITTEETVPVMWEDGYGSSHPLAVKVKTKGEIVSSVFDTVTSRKGAAIMRTVESVFGVSQVQNGFKNYLNKNKNSVGVISDFYSGFTLPSIMSTTTVGAFLTTWIGQMNFPVVEVQLVRQGTNTVFNFAQDRFLWTIYNEEDNPIYTSDYKWQILVKCKAGGTYNATGTESQHFVGSIDDITVFLTTVRTSVTMNGRSYTWIKCNPNFESYYTTEYSKNIYEAFDGAFSVNHKAFSVGDRANLIHNSFQLAYRGDFSYSVPSSLSQYAAYREKDYLPWKTFMYHVNLIANLLEHRPVFKSLAIYGESLVESLQFDYDLYQESSVPKAHLTYLLESSSVEFLCRLQEEYCLNKATEIYSKIPMEYFNNPNDNINPVPANIRASVYKYHIQNTYDYEDWFDVYQIYELAGDAQEKNAALLSLAGSRSIWLLNLYFAELLDRDSHVKKQDFFQVVDAVSKNPSGRHTAWYFYRHYYDELIELFTADDYEYGQSIKYICETFENRFFLDEMFDFFYSHPSAGSSIFARQQAIDVVENNIFWIVDRETDVANNLLGPFKEFKSLKA